MKKERGGLCVAVHVGGRVCDGMGEGAREEQNNEFISRIIFSQTPSKQ